MSVQAAFNPAYGTGITVAPTNTSASSTIGVGSKSLVLTNLGSLTIYVRVGTGSTTATTADYPGTGSIHIMAGEGY
jgi:hypothetical protein